MPDIGEPLGLRDRAMLETLYSTGIRRKELMHLKLYDLDRERGTLMIRQGKGKKDRMVPIGERAHRVDAENICAKRARSWSSSRTTARCFSRSTGEPFIPTI